MAQDRLYITCRQCGESLSLYSIPSAGYAPKEIEPDAKGQFLDAWIAEHIRHNEAAVNGLFTFGDPSAWFTLETEGFSDPQSTLQRKANEQHT